MQFTSFVKNKSSWKFQVKNVDICILNALRRIGMCEIPTVALDFDPAGKDNKHIKIEKNISSLHNEFLMHRLSLIPFHFNQDEIDKFDASKYVFTLKKENNTTGIIDVTTNDIVIMNQEGTPYNQAFHKRVLPPSLVTKDYILITKLKPNEVLDIEFVARLGTGSEHARWSPVSQFVCSYTSDKVPNKSLGILDAERDFAKNKFGEPIMFSIAIESECGLLPDQIISKCFEILIDKIDKLVIAIKKNDSNKVVIEENSVMNIVRIKNEGHTLVDVLQSIIYNNTIKEGKDKRLAYIGYYKPHPLEPTMVMKMKLAEDSVNLKDYLVEKLEEVTNYIHKVRDAWQENL